ncbi:MAG: ArsR family transcriptional regulator [Bacteroidota bacterium]
MKLLLRFFLNPEASSYLRGLEEDFGESTNAIRIELNRFEAAGLLVSWDDKNKKMFGANQNHPLFNDIISIMRKHTGIDTIVDKVVKNMGDIKSAYLIGLVNAKMILSPFELIIFGENVDLDYLTSLTNKSALLLKRDLIAKILPPDEEHHFIKNNPHSLLIWKNHPNKTTP